MLAHQNLAIWFIILTRLVACPFTCTLYLLLALPCVAWCTSACLLIFLSNIRRDPSFQFFVTLDSCLFSAWTPKLQVPDADYTWSFVELDSVTSRALVLSALNFQIICGSERNLWSSQVSVASRRVACLCYRFVTRLMPVPTEEVTNYRFDVTWAEGELCHCKAPPKRKHRKSPVPRYQRLFGPSASSLHTHFAFAPVLLLCASIAFIGWMIVCDWVCFYYLDGTNV